MKLRSQNGLSEYTPPDAFLTGNFLADETIRPSSSARSAIRQVAFLSGHLAHRGRRAPADRSPGQQSGPIEYSIYLEADCPGKVTYYIFVDRSFNPDKC